MRDLSHIKPFQPVTAESFSDTEAKPVRDLSHVRPFKPTPVKEPSLVEKIASFGREALEAGSAVTTGMGAGIHDAMTGVIQTGIDVAESAGLAEKGASKAFAQSKFANLKTEKEETGLGKAGQVVGGLMAYGALPGSTITRLVGSGAAIGATQFDPEAKGLTARGKLGLEGAATAGLVGKGFQTLGKGTYGILPSTRAKKKVAEAWRQMSPEQQKAALQSAQAGRRLGVTTSMGEASQAPGALGMEKYARVTTKAKASEAERLVQNTTQLTKAADKILNNTLKGGIEKHKQIAGKLYDIADETKLPETVNKQLRDVSDDILSKIVGKEDSISFIKKTGALAKETGTVGKWQGVKQALREELKKKSLNSANKKEVQQLINKIDDTIKAHSPELRKADKIWARLKPFEEMNETLSRIKLKPGQTTYTPFQAYDELMSTATKQKDFLNAVSNAGGDVKTARALISTLNRLKNSPLGKIAEKEVGMQNSRLPVNSRGMLEAVTDKTANFFLGRYSNQLLKLVSSDRWVNEVTKISKIKNPYSQVDRLANLLSKLAADKKTEE